MPDNLIKNVRATRTKTGAFRLDWEPSRPDLEVKVFSGSAANQIDQSAPVAEVAGQSFAEIDSLEPALRYFFLVAPEGGRAVLTADRRIYLPNTYNFRDLGGYDTTDGRSIKWERVYRSDALSRLKDEDQAQLASLDLKLVVDLRSREEQAKSPDLLPPKGGPEYLPLPIQSAEMNFVTAMKLMKKGDVSWLTEDFMRKGYIRNLDDYPEIWRELFLRLSQSQNRPLAFHCTGGKDRAGTGAALVLLALGVPEETVIQDHQLSNLYIGGVVEAIYAQVEGYGIDPEQVRPYFTAPLDAIQALLKHLREEYGSADNYLVHKAGLSPTVLENLRRDLLE